MKIGSTKQAEAVTKLFVVFVGHKPSEVELFECEQSLFFLGRALFRYIQLLNKRGQHANK